MKANIFIAPAVHDKDGDLNFRQLVHGIVLNAADQPNWQKRKQFASDIRHAGKCVLQNHAADSTT